MMQFPLDPEAPATANPLLMRQGERGRTPIHQAPQTPISGEIVRALLRHVAPAQYGPAQTMPVWVSGKRG